MKKKIQQDIEIEKDFKPFIFEANVYFTRFDMMKRLGHMVSNMYNDIEIRFDGKLKNTKFRAYFQDLSISICVKPLTPEHDR